MSYLVLARKWRPQVFEEVVGQAHVVRTLKNALVSNRIAHAFLFTGQRGVGKTTIARILAKALNCEQGPTPRPCGQCPSCREIAEGNSMDVMEIDGASNTGVDDVRELREWVKYVPSRDRYKIYIIDEVHMLSNSAFNALLKTLEEPPPHVIFMFATTEPYKIPSTVVSRCQRFDLRRLPLEALIAQLSAIATQERITISKQGLRWIAAEAEGSMRDAQSILDRIISYAGNQVRDEDIIEVLGMVDRRLLFRASEAVLGKDARGCLAVVKDLFYGGCDTGQFYKAFLEHLRNLIVVKTSGDSSSWLELPDHEYEALQAQVKDSEVETLQRLFDVWCKAEEEINRSSQPHLVLEMTLLKMVYLTRLLPLDSALARLTELEKKLLNIREEKGGDSNASPPSFSFDTQGRFDSEDVPVHLEEEQILDFPQQRGGQNREQVWEQFLTYAKKDKPLLAAVLNHGQLLSLTGEVMELGFPSRSIFMESAQDLENRKQLEALVKRFLGRSIKIKLSPLKEGNNPGLAEQPGGEEREGGRNTTEEVAGDPLVAEALRIFNGKIVEVKEINDG